MGLAEEARLAVRIDLTGNATSGVGKLNSQVNSLGKSVGRVGKGFGQITSGLARAGLVVGGAAIAGLAGAAKAAIDFEDAFAGVRKTVDEADLTKAGLSFDKLARQFRDMATEIPVAATELARIGEAAGALGIRASDIQEFTKTVALLSVTTNLTSDAAAEDLGKIGTILSLRGKDFTTFADALVNLGNKGASTESEIIEVTKRFGAAGKAAGLSTPTILGFASAIASAGVEPEAAGSSLSRLFSNLVKETALASKSGKAFAKVSGKSFKDFAKIVKTDTTGAMLLFLKSLKGLDKFESAKALEAVGITNVRDQNAIRLLAQTYDTNLIPALENAKNATGALGVEAQKRFDTVKASVQLLHNNITEAAITIGEGFAPALGRAAKKLSEFLKQDANKSALKSIGEDIGKAIDGIDWQKVLDGAKDFVGVMKGALSITLRILDTINSLPTEIKAAGAALLILNKASGGLVGAGVGNVVGGLAGAAATGLGSKLPGVGRLFAQPVFVTNWPIGGIGGGIGGAAGGGLVATLGAVAIPVTIAAVGAKAAADLTNAQFAEKGIKTDFAPPGEGPFGIISSLKAIDQGIKLLRGDVVHIVPANFGALVAQKLTDNRRAPSDPKPENFQPKLTDSFDRAKVPAITNKLVTLQDTFDRARGAITEKVGAAGSETAGAARMAGNQVTGAIAAKQMSYTTNVSVDVHVTASNVQKSIVIQKRSGPAIGSRGTDGRSGNLL